MAMKDDSMVTMPIPSSPQVVLKPAPAPEPIPPPPLKEAPAPSPPPPLPPPPPPPSTPPREPEEQAGSPRPEEGGPPEEEGPPEEGGPPGEEEHFGEEAGDEERDGESRPTTRSESKATGTTCMKCDTERSEYWHRTSHGIVLCLNCCQDSGISTKGLKNKVHAKRINNLQNKKGGKKNKEGKTRKATHKLPHKEATYITSSHLYYKGVKYRAGDVFSIRGEERTYYVCVRSFLEDPLCNQYAVIIWLLPLYPSPAAYAPADFLLGPAEDVPRPLDCLSFVSHLPPQGHVTLNELRTYDSMPQLWAAGAQAQAGLMGVQDPGAAQERGALQEPPRDQTVIKREPEERTGLELLLQAMEPDIQQIR